MATGTAELLQKVRGAGIRAQDSPKIVLERSALSVPERLQQRREASALRPQEPNEGSGLALKLQRRVEAPEDCPALIQEPHRALQRELDVDGCSGVPKRLAEQLSLLALPAADGADPVPPETLGIDGASLGHDEVVSLLRRKVAERDKGNRNHGDHNDSCEDLRQHDVRLLLSSRGGDAHADRRA